MEESEDNMSSEDLGKVDGPSAVKKPKKRSLVERELETNMTARVTSPAAVAQGLSTSRYGRARRLKTDTEFIGLQKAFLASVKSPDNENTPVLVQSPVYRMYASNSPHKPETPKKASVTYLDNQIDNIYQENISLSRFSDETGTPSPAKKFPKVYIRKDLIQNREEEETVMLIKNLFSPSKNASNFNLSDSSVHSTEKYNAKHNGLVDNSSVVKTLDFDSKRKKKKEQKGSSSKNELFEVEAKCLYQVGDLAWARVGTFPFWPCIVTRDPYSEMFVKKKLFGRVEHDIIHVTFFGDNGRRSWIVDNMLRKYQGQLEFQSTREKFTVEDKKKDPRLYAAFFVSEKKLALWNTSVQEADSILREPKRLRIEIFNDMLWKSRATKNPVKSNKISSRNDSDVSLSESLYDSLFSEKDVKADDAEQSQKSRNKSFDVSEVVTACLDNMAAKTGITKIQRQSHMDRWLQKAKSKTPEKTQVKPAVLKLEKPEKVQVKPSAPVKLTRKSSSKNITKPVPSPSVNHAKPYRFTRRTESHYKLAQIESKNDLGIEGTSSQTNNYKKSIAKSEDINSISSDLKVSANVDKESNSSQDISIVVIIDNDDNNTHSKHEPIVQNTDEPVNDSAMDTIEVKHLKSITDKATDANRTNSAIISIEDDHNEAQNQADVESTTNEAHDTLYIAKKIKHNESRGSETIDTSSVVDTSANFFETKNEFNAEAIIQLNQDTQLSQTIEKGNEITSTYIDIKSQNFKANNTDPMEMSKEYQDVSPEAKSKIFVSNVNCQDSLMEVDENTNSVKIVQDKFAKSNFCESANNSVMRVDKCTNVGSEVKGDTCPNSETVSNKSVGSNVTDLKEVRNIVTIEVSVTEKKNDDTLNNLPHEGEQESINNLNPSPLADTKMNDLIFLDEGNNHNTSNARVNSTITPENSSTPEKYKRRDTKGQESNKFSRETLHLESKITCSNSDNIFRNEKEVIKLTDDSNKSSVLIENGVFIDDEINDTNKTVDCRNDVFNDSGNSESILQLYNDGAELEKGEALLETPFDISSESIIESSQSNEKVNENFTKKETTEYTENIGNETGFEAEDNQKGSIRQYVESPTFTQLLDSEEFFRDVNETHNSCTMFETESSKQCPELQKNTANQVVKHIKTVESNKIDNFEDEDTSEDEPSPEYESLDDEITEDFRKHMMSIENNIKDKKNEEQIVKICNEIAEKAKLSPTKYTQDDEIVNHFIPNEKLGTNVISVNRPLINLIKKKYLKENDTIHKEKANMSSLDERHNIKVPHTVLTKDLNRSDKQTRIDIQTYVVSEKNEDCKIHIEDINLKMNGNAALHEISDNPKIIYRTRSSLRSSSKECASPDIKVESSIVEQYRKSCEYEPKVVIIRLERDKIDSSIRASKPKPLDDDKCKNNKFQISLNDSPNDNKQIENKIVDNDEGKSKNRKSRSYLKRDSPKSKKALIKTVQHQSEIQDDNSKNLTTKAIKKTEIEITATKVPKKIDIGNDTFGTGIPVKTESNPQNLETIFTDTPDWIDDSDVDDEWSDDSEVSLPNSVVCIPKRNLRPRAERTLEFALKDPKFLEYLELKQDYVIELHPELNDDEVVNYIHKSWQYQEDLKSDTNKIDYIGNSQKQETHSRSNKSIKSQPKHSIENHFREKYEKPRNTIDFGTESGTIINYIETVEQKLELNIEECMDKKELPVTKKKHSKTPDYIDLTLDKSNDTYLDNDKRKDIEDVSVNSEENMTLRKSSRSRMTKALDKQINDAKGKSTSKYNLKKERDIDTESVDSEDSEIPLRQLRSMVLRESSVNGIKKETSPEKKVDEFSASKEPIVNNDIKEEGDEIASTVSDNEPLLKQKTKRIDKHSLADPEFIEYSKERQDTLMDENPQLTQDEIVQYLHKTWLYKENSKSAVGKNNELEQGTLVKGQHTNNNDDASSKKVRRRPKVEKLDASEVTPKEKPRRRLAQPFYDENYSDIEEEIELFEIFKTKKTAVTIVSKAETEKVKSPCLKSLKGESLKVAPQMERVINIDKDDSDVEYVDETEIYFTELTTPKPNIFKGLIREKVCEICECAGSLVKCKGCYGMFHSDCVKKQSEPTEKVKEFDLPLKGRKKKRKSIRKPKSLDDSESLSDEKSHDMSADTSLEDIVLPEVCTIDAEYFESQLEVKMKEILEAADSNINYDSYSSDDGIDWENSVPGKCEIVDVKLKRRSPPIDYSDYKCHKCQKHNVPLCFVCKSAVSKTEVKMRQKCHVAHCHKYYHLECLDHWPQTQFNSGEPSRNNKKKNQYFETLTCPRHVCHTCVSDDPRGCKTRFSGDKLAKCVRCPATYHSFNKCLPAGSQILTASHIICPRHSEQKAGRASCHVNTGWCFICALGGSLICCEYCPTSFHAECLNIKPPEGNYMCEDCETGRLPLYGEMVWVKLGQYRWWPGKILHPSEIPENIMLVKHDLGDFVVRFFGQYDHFWVNRGRVFPYQEGDSGRISSQKSKINADFILAIEHAQRAYNILKNAVPDEEESLDIASSLLPPHYVKLKSNKASGALCGRKIDDPSLSLTQCECNPEEPDPCGPYSQCLNRMLLTECGPTCRAGERCHNRAFEKRLYPRLTPYRTPQRGWGLKTLDDVKAGQFVIEYVGELIDEEEFRRRMRRKHEIRDENFYFLTLDKERMIDAGPKGNVARFMNHCCEPNCETQKWTVLGDVRVGLFAIDDIPADSEVTFNYNLECTGIEKKRCLCGAKRCSGYIGAKPKQDESQSKKGKVKKTFNKKKKPESPSTSKTKKKLGRPCKPKELTDLEKDVLIIKNATNISSDESPSTEDQSPKLKRKTSSISTEKVTLCNGQLEDKPKSLKRKRVSISTEKVSICNGQEPCAKKQKCDEPSEVGD